MKRFVVLFVLIIVLTLSITSLAFAHNDRDSRHFEVDLASLNNSGVTGKAEISVEGDMIKVKIEAEGLEPGMPHPQHIHGFDTPKNATCPGPDRDTDGDGFISVGEGLPDYGPVILPLTPFNQVNEEGELRFEATYPIPDGLQPIDTLQNRAVVLHGLTVDGQYVPSMPIACGQIERSPNGPKDH